ncbi:MAG: competence/damage-inducible protein A [Cellvibrionaceae bacterium]|nr:competence/damage-inducible protein A [Cellvibrionaceae bacterium]|tara:strand:- start:13163 stop:13927 length:765 start_codon:yes stop_codon:yes gene_type:complete
MNVGLIIVGDEILSGRRADKHLPYIVDMLNQRGLCLAWARIMGDDREDLINCYRESFAKGDIVLSTGGIGATPDDLTREAVAAATETVTERHPQGAPLLEELARERGRDLTAESYRLVEFPKDARLIPNPVNRIPGFSVADHHFVPGFPQMAWPMLEWVMDTYYSDLGDDSYREYAVILEGANESTIIPLMEAVMAKYSDVKAFSLPIIDGTPRIEFGIKGPMLNAKLAFEFLKQGLSDLSLPWRRLESHEQRK